MYRCKCLKPLTRLGRPQERLRADGWQQYLPLVVSARPRRRCSPGSSCSSPGLLLGGRVSARPAASPYRPHQSRTAAAARAVDIGVDRQCPPLRRRRSAGRPRHRSEPRRLADDPGAGRHDRATGPDTGLRDHRRKLGRSARSTRSARRSPAARSCIRSTRIAPSSIAAASSRRCCCRSSSAGAGMSAARAAAGRAARRHARGTAAPARRRRTRPPSPRSCGHSRCSPTAQQRGYRVYPGPQPAAVRKLGLLPGRPRHGHQRHAARRPGARHGDLADHEQRDRRHGDRRAQRPDSQISINNAQVAAEAAAAAAQPDGASRSTKCRPRPVMTIPRSDDEANAVCNRLTSRRGSRVSRSPWSLAPRCRRQPQPQAQAQRRARSRRTTRTPTSRRSSRPSARSPARTSSSTRA